MTNVNAIFVLRFQYEFTGEEQFFNEEEVDTEMLFSGKDKTCIICGNIDDGWHHISATSCLLSDEGDGSVETFERIAIPAKSADNFSDVVTKALATKYRGIFEHDPDDNFKNSLKSLMSRVVADVCYEEELYAGVYTGGTISIEDPIEPEYADKVQYTISRTISYIEGGIDLDPTDTELLNKFADDGEWADKYEILAIGTLS